VPKSRSFLRRVHHVQHQSAAACSAPDRLPATASGIIHRAKTFSDLAATGYGLEGHARGVPDQVVSQESSRSFTDRLTTFADLGRRT
jgi:hypothetical protein